MAAAKKAAAKKTASSPSKKGGDLRVTAPLVAVTTSNDTVIQLWHGDIVPEGVKQESLDHLQDLGYVTKGDVPESDESSDENE
jgi:hypothetical protein